MNLLAQVIGGMLILGVILKFGAIGAGCFLAGMAWGGLKLLMLGTFDVESITAEKTE